MKEHKVLRERLITELLPIFNGSGFEGATLGHVLDQTTGVEFIDSRYAQNDVMSLVAAITAQDKANGFVTSSNGSKDAVGELKFVMKLPKTHDHGTYFNYGNVNPAVAIAVVEQLYDNKSFAEIFAEKVWSRIGAEQNAYVLVDHTGFALGAAGMGSTLRDFARWGLAHLPSSNSEAIPREFIDDLLADHEFRVDLKRGSPFRFDPNWHFLSGGGNYRNFYTVLNDGEKTALLPTGHGAQICAVYPQFDVVVAQFASQLNPEPTMKQHYATMAIVAEYVATQYRNQGL
jgi:CubicO group peptidase (beta-lactamase class C family)